MTRYTEDSRDQVRDAVDMLDLVSSRVELRRAGVNSYFGLCPFHDERSSSFHVRPDEKHYHCFGCGESGDPFSFVMETEGLDFRGALEALGERYGVELAVADENPEEAARRERRTRLHALLDRAAAYYARYLWEAVEAAPARTYLAGRGLSDEVLRAFRVGYAPSAWDRMLLASRQAGFTEAELLGSGLAQRSRQRGSIYDRFRGRVMFPLADARGNVAGFGARAMRENQPPKYLNTGESEIFHKGSQLFGLDVARRQAARSGRVVLAEGYTDVLALHQAGVTNAVGVMGTSFTDEQARELERVAQTLELALDADRAGQEAMLRAARVAAGRKLELRVVPLPEGADPADLLSTEGPEALRARVERSAPFVAFQVDRVLSAADTSSAEGKDRALQELRPLLRPLGTSVLREELVRRVAGRLALSEPLVGSLVASTGNGARVAAEPSRAGPSTAGAAPSRPPAALDRRERTERTFLALCIALPEHGRGALARIDPAEHFTSDVLRRAALHLRDHLDAPMAALPPDDDELAALVPELALRFSREPAARTTLELEALQLEKARVERRIAAARGSETGLAELAAERESVRQRIDAVTERIDREG